MLSDLVATSRPLSWINTAYPFAVSYWLLTGHIDLLLVLGTIFFLVPYNLFMYGVNDVFDYESDLLNPRKGGAEGAIVDRGRHRIILWAVAVTTTPCAVALGILSGWLASLVLLVVLFAVYAYSGPRLRFKEIPFLDSATSATHFVGPAIFGIVAADHARGGGSWTLPVVCIVVAFFAWSMSSQAFGAVQDVVPDRAAGLRSIATVCGSAPTVRLSVIGYVVAAILLVVGGFSGAPALFWVAPLSLIYALSISPWWKVTDQESGASHAGWVRFLWLNYLVGFLVTMVIIFTVIG